MNFTAGLSATKAGFDLVKSLREALGRPDVNPGDIQARLVELQSLMLDAQRAVADAEEENRQLRRQLREREDLALIQSDLELADDGEYYVRKSERAAGKAIPYCPVCWGTDQKLIPLRTLPDDRVFECAIHKVRYFTKAYRNGEKAVTVTGVVGRQIFDPNKVF